MVSVCVILVRPGTRLKCNRNTVLSALNVKLMLPWCRMSRPKVSVSVSLVMIRVIATLLT